MEKYYKYSEETGVYSPFEVYYREVDLEDENEYCPDCHSYSCLVTKYSEEEKSIDCYCCGCHSLSFYEYDSFWGDIVIIDLIEKKTSNKDKDCAFIVKIEKDDYAFYYNSWLIKKIFIDEPMNEVLECFNELNINNNLSLVKTNPKEQKVEVIEGLYKGLIINLSNYKWSFKNIPEGIQLKEKIEDTDNTTYYVPF